MIDSFSGEFRFLSNFYESPIWPRWWPRTLPPFPTVEHAFQAAKVQQGGDWLWEVEQMRTAQTPGRAKRLGRKVELGFNWNDAREGEMRSLLREKFSDPLLREMLDRTGDQTLVEGNTWGDTFWGACWETTLPLTDWPRDQWWSSQNGRELVGRNTLGRLLMEIRDGREV